MLNYIRKILNSETPENSKRLIGISGSFSLIFAMFIWHTDVLVYSVAALTFGALAITGFETIFKNK